MLMVFLRLKSIEPYTSRKASWSIGLKTVQEGKYRFDSDIELL